jgi:hypothetical protein
MAAGVFRIGAAPGATLACIPTSRKRHTITETDEVERALRPLRERMRGRIDFGELVRLGAGVKLERLDSEEADAQRRRELRERFLTRTRTGEGVDFERLREAHERGCAQAADG